MDSKKEPITAENNPNQDEEWEKIMSKKQQEVNQLREKDEKLHQIELLYQREKEYLMDQYKQVFPDKPAWNIQQFKTETPHVTDDKGYNEVYELVKQIHQQEKHIQVATVQVQEERARKTLIEVNQLMRKEEHNECSESLLYKWYLKIKTQIKSDESKSTSQKDTKLSSTDKLFYNVKYQVRNDTLDLPKPRQGQKSLPGNCLEMVSFSTRHKGTCVNVNIVETELTTLSSSVEVSTDPYITDCRLQALASLHNGQPIEFAQVVWKYIDTEI